MELILSARSKEQESTDYLSLQEQGLTASIKVAGGDGNPKNPFQATVSICNENKTMWSGVIHIELSFPKVNPRFFLPAFMYGRNRGETPQRVHCEFPRLREDNPARPSSSWWMMRSDRLSHPTALVYDSGKIYGLSASPYFILVNGEKQQWMPGKEGSFYQYGGYSCSLSKGTVGYTLGYEDAPLQFINAYQIKERAKLAGNCFEFMPKETVTLTLNLFQYTATGELDINAAIQVVYGHYHQAPRKAVGIRTAVADLAKAVYQDAWLPEDKSYAGQVMENADSGGYRYNKIFSLSWTNGLRAYLRTLRRPDSFMP